MTAALRIRDWNTYFENNRTRELKKLDWIPVPNKMDGDGFTELVTDHPDGPGHFAVWVLILQLASKCDVRGTLVRSNGMPHDARSISRMTRMPEPLVTVAMSRLTEIGWLEYAETATEAGFTVTEQRANGAPVPELTPNQPVTESRANPAPGCDIVPVPVRESAVPSACAYGLQERKRTEENRTASLPTPNGRVRARGPGDPPGTGANLASATATERAAPENPENPRAGPEEPAPEVCLVADSLVIALMPGHARHGPVGPELRAARFAAERLARAPDPASKAAVYRANHEASCRWWADHPGCFVPHVWRWFADGDCEHPPPDEQAMKRKEPVSELMQWAIEEQAARDAKAARKAAVG